MILLHEHACFFIAPKSEYPFVMTLHGQTFWGVGFSVVFLMVAWRSLWKSSISTIRANWELLQKSGDLATNVAILYVKAVTVSIERSLKFGSNPSRETKWWNFLGLSILITKLWLVFESCPGHCNLYTTSWWLWRRWESMKDGHVSN